MAEKYYVVTLTRSIIAESEDDAKEKFEYELKNELYDGESIEVEQVKKADF